MKIAFYSEHGFPLYNRHEKFFTKKIGELITKCDLYKEWNSLMPSDYDALILGQLYSKSASKWSSVCTSFAQQNKPIIVVQQSNCFDRFPFETLPSHVASQITMAMPYSIFRTTRMKKHHPTPPLGTGHSGFRHLPFNSICLADPLELLNCSRERFFRKYDLDDTKKLFCVFADRSDRFHNRSKVAAHYTPLFYRDLINFKNILGTYNYQLVFKLHRNEKHPKVKRKTLFKGSSFEAFLDNLNIPYIQEEDDIELKVYSDLSLSFGSTQDCSLHLFDLPVWTLNYENDTYRHLKQHAKARLNRTRTAQVHPTTPLNGEPFKVENLIMGIDSSLEELTSSPGLILEKFLPKTWDPPSFSANHYVWPEAYGKKMSHLATAIVNNFLG